MGGLINTPVHQTAMGNFSCLVGTIVFVVVFLNGHPMYHAFDQPPCCWNQPKTGERRRSTSSTLKTFKGNQCVKICGTEHRTLSLQAFPGSRVQQNQKSQKQSSCSAFFAEGSLQQHFHLFKNMFYFPLLVLRESITGKMFLFSRGKNTNGSGQDSAFLAES